jgi:mycothiol synthase
MEPIKPQLIMHRSTLKSLPDLHLPLEFSLRSSREGDDLHWTRIIRESFPETSFEDNFFQSTMVDDPAYAPDRILFVCAPDGLPCATASAYRRESFGPSVGYVHFVGVRPQYVGRKLGAAVTIAVLIKFVEQGLEEAYLETDDFRLPAISIYLRLGFVPSMQHESHPSRWRTIYKELGLNL